jgi:rod shape determining protein RodA
MLFQIFQNIGMTLGLTPVSGLPLPFISYGGSHLVSSALLIGLAQSIYMRRLR